jgi:glycosyltransferase involved in cell wall biosynthesis
VHGTYSTEIFGIKNFFLKIWYNSVMLRGDRVIVVSNFIKNYIETNYPNQNEEIKDKISVVHRGVDLEYFSAAKVSNSRIAQITTQWNLPDDKQIILLPARVTAWKGHEFLIESLAQVKNQNFCCIMAGSSRNHEEFCKRLEEKIKTHNLEGKIKMVDATKDMPAAYMVSDFVISSSVRPEAFGRIAIEAGAMGKIIIATNIGGSLETVVDNQTGFLVEAGNTSQMAIKIDQVLSLDAAQREIISQKALTRISENFSNEKMSNDTIQIYNS